ncbi:MAG: glycoside hydrolase family 5 protein [Bacteroides sp.]|uniref:glycoside hydrolase family 5 protein n=1 Tax=Phocaeicola sartorii TaxID=671267 RepID=UPI001B16A0BA|nr:glycoside hydrolase family 5 protein [Phocaeicola sartorii]MBO5507539.1 glycoside hydrolase family 5 protein [Bacteroides sp.]
MKNVMCALLFAGTLVSCQQKQVQSDSAVPAPEAFVRVSGQDLIQPDGSKLFIKGTNLGNWLNPEGYMFGFNKTNSERFINEMFCEAVGPDFVTEFWKLFKDNYITRKDVEFIASTGANTIRLPFHYKLFTDEDYMGLTVNQDGFARVDSVVNWCRDNHLYLILDMHDAPGGQTGDNIDDSYGYPWLFESEASQQLFCDIWRKIADYYKNEPVILGYELINEPIAPYFENMEELNGKLEAVHKLAVKAIREVDNNHIVLIGGSQWNGNFKPFKDSKYDDKLMYTCHRYGGEPTKAAIQEIINFRDSVNLPMYMGEIGHNTDEWQTAFCKTMEENNIGYTFWPYKKLNGSSFLGINAPDDWDLVVAFSEASRGTYKEIRDVRPRQELVKKAMLGFIENSKCENCMPQTGYIRSLGLQVNK